MRDAEFIRAVGIGAADHLDHQPHERRVLKAQVAGSDGFIAAVLINHHLDVLLGRVWGGVVCGIRYEYCVQHLSVRVLEAGSKLSVERATLSSVHRVGAGLRQRPRGGGQTSDCAYARNANRLHTTSKSREFTIMAGLHEAPMQLHMNRGNTLYLMLQGCTGWDVHVCACVAE